MNSKPLKGKICTYDDGSGSYMYIRPKDVKSALNGFIKFHEDRIEEAIEILETKRISRDLHCYILGEIQTRYESLMAIQKWMEDVI